MASDNPQATSWLERDIQRARAQMAAWGPPQRIEVFVDGARVAGRAVRQEYVPIARAFDVNIVATALRQIADEMEGVQP